MDNFEITWHIKNFHFCWHKTCEWLESPLFEIELSDKTFWRLHLYPRGEDDGDYVSCYLFREKGGPEVVDLDFELFLKDESLVITETYFKKHSFKINQREGLTQMASRYQIFTPESDQRDTFVLRFGCRIFNRVRDELKCKYKDMLTLIEKERIHGTEIFSDDKDVDPDCLNEIKVKPMLDNESLINIKLSCIEKNLVVKILPVNCRKVKYAICKITLIKIYGKESPINHIRSWIGEVKSDIWRYSILPEADFGKPRHEIFASTTFVLHYDFAFSTGEFVEKSGSEYCSYVTTQSFPLQQYFNDSLKTFNSADTALEVLEGAYSSQSFVDFDFKSGTETFPVHKALLSARSPILKLLIDLNCTGAKLIPLEDHLAQQLISFLYTDTVVFLSLSNASELYSVASFLKIELLKTKCRNFLRDKLDLHHVGEILNILPSMGNFSLKSAVESFIVTLYDLVIPSMKWDTLGHGPELRRQIVFLKYKKRRSKKNTSVNWEILRQEPESAREIMLLKKMEESKDDTDVEN